MCWLCEQYGDPEHGNGLWYLNPRNYSRNMYKLRPPGEGFGGVLAGGGETGASAGGPKFPELLEAMEKSKEEFERVRTEMYDSVKNAGGSSQVVPLRDADKVLELCSPVGLIDCVCRKRFRARDERNELEYTCMGMGVGMLKWERWPERYKGGVKFVNVAEAKEWNHEMDRRGFVHILMLFGTPYIGGFCQCEYPDCEQIRMAVDFGLLLTKGHYVAVVDYDKCNGCGICAQRCQFGALKYEVGIQKANIDQLRCYGCGLCETGCPREAIRLVERKSIPALAEVW